MKRWIEDSNSRQKAQIQLTESARYTQKPFKTLKITPCWTKSLRCDQKPSQNQDIAKFSFSTLLATLKCTLRRLVKHTYLTFLACPTRKRVDSLEKHIQLTVFLIHGTFFQKHAMLLGKKTQLWTNIVVYSYAGCGQPLLWNLKLVFEKNGWIHKLQDYKYSSQNTTNRLPEKKPKIELHDHVPIKVHPEHYPHEFGCMILTKIPNLTRLELQYAPLSSGFLKLR